MLHTLFRMWNATKGYLGFKPDPRPDPEDAITYSHAEKVHAMQQVPDYPIQIHSDGRNKDKVDKLPAGIDNYRVDVYTSPDGDGYQIVYETTRGGKPFEKVINVGPEEFREKDWTEVEGG